MPLTRIVLDRQSDLILTSATLSTPHISSPTGLVQADISGLTSSLASLEAKDNSIDVRISGELSRLNAVDTSIGERVTLEESYRNSGDVSLTTKLSTEESTRVSADNSVTTKISNEESVRASADDSLSVRVSGEESTRQSADDSLSSRLSTETSVRNSADDSIGLKISIAQASIDYMLSDANSNLDQFYEVVNYIESLDLVNDNNLIGVVTSENLRLTAEASIRLAADNSLTARISGETSARISGDESLSSKVSLEVSRRESADISLVAKLSNDITTSNSTNDNLISIEEDLRASVDISLEDLINSQGLQETLNIGSLGTIASEFTVEILDPTMNGSTLTTGANSIQISNLTDAYGNVIFSQNTQDKGGAVFSSIDGGIPNASLQATLFGVDFGGFECGIALDADLYDVKGISYAKNGGELALYFNQNHLQLGDFGSSQTITIQNSGMIITDDRHYRGLEYAGAYEANFVTHSIITKNYADTVDLSLEERISIEESIVDYNDKYGQIESIRVSVSQASAGRGDADVAISSNISSFTSANVSREASLTQRANTEKNTRNQSVISLATRLTNESTSRVNADGSLHNSVVAQQSRIDAMLLNSTDGLNQFYEVVNYVNSLDLVNDNQLLSSQIALNGKITAEESVTLSADLSLSSRISTEETNTSNADNSLTTRVSDEESLRASGDLSLENKLSADLNTANSSINNRISIEESVRVSADDSLTTRLSLEESARLSVDSSIHTKITNFDPGLVEFVSISGTINGTNSTFVASKNLSNATLVFVLLNGLVQFPSNDYTFDNVDTFTFNTPPSVNSRVDAFYFDLSSI